MTITNTFDVLVVYTEIIATSASSTDKKSITPFTWANSREHYASAYSYFLEKCKEIGLTAAFTTSADIIGPGTCNSYWLFENKKWKKVNENGYSTLIFDKVSPNLRKLKKKRDLLFLDGTSKPFNNSKLMTLFNDKLKTFTRLQSLTIPTVNISIKTVVESLLKLEVMIADHKNKDDFSNNFILKDRFGSGGVNIFKINKNPIDEISKILLDSPKISFVLQPFTKFDKGYSYHNVKQHTDIRIIYSQGKIVQRYIRTAKEQDFRCNEHQGGKVIYVNSTHIPASVTKISNNIIKQIKGENAFFALDFIVSNNGNAYFLEGNINPGIYWGINSNEDKINTKKLIKIIITELKRRSDVTKADIFDVVNIHKPVFDPRVYPLKPILVV